MLLARNASFRVRALSTTGSYARAMTASRAAKAVAARMAAARPPPRSITAVRCAGEPARSFATASDDDRAKAKPSRWDQLRELFREHGLAFGALYVGANVVTFIPIFGALTFGGVDGPELILWAADQLEITYDLSFINTIHKDLVNAFIALELNAWVEPVRLPAVIAYTPRASRWLKARRGGAEPVESVKAEPEPASAPPRKNEKRRRRRRGG